jgi:hypothetical protein
MQKLMAGLKFNSDAGQKTREQSRRRGRCGPRQFVILNVDAIV